MRYTLLLLLTSLFVLSGCLRKKKEPVIYKYETFDEEFRSYVMPFGTGSEFIYLHEGTGKYDTTVVEKAEIGYWVEDSLASQNILIYKERLDIFYECQRTVDFRTTSSFVRPDVFSFTVTYDVGGGFNVWKAHGVYTSPDAYFNGSPPDTAIVKVLDTLQVLDHVFTDVLFMRERAANGYEDLYFVKGVGIVKKIDEFKRVMLLKEWHHKN